MDEASYRLSEVFNVLGNGVRLQLVEILHEGSANVSSMAEAVEKPDQTVSRHLKILRDSDLVQAESRGRKRKYWLKRPELIERCLAIKKFVHREE